jgi:hypothetical protein
MKAGVGKPVSIEKGALLSGTIVSLGVTSVKDKTTGISKNVDFFTLKDLETGEPHSYWMDAGIKQALSQNGIIAPTENGLVIKNQVSIGIEHLGMTDLGGGKRANNYQIYMPGAN